MTGEISYDLAMDDNMPFVEGTYRLGGEWKVFIFLAKKESVRELRHSFTTWDSGVSGIVYEVPPRQILNKQTVQQLLSHALGVSVWSEVPGPDSMTLR